MKKLNFGCGRKILKDYVNADIQEGEGITSFDFNQFPYPFKDNTFDYILCKDILQCLIHPTKVLNELHRISKDKAIIKIIIPYYNSKCAYNDLENRHYFNETIFSVITNPKLHYGLSKPNFKLFSLKFIPTRLGRLIYPEKLRIFLSRLIPEIIHIIEGDLEVIK